MTTSKGQMNSTELTWCARHIKSRSCLCRNLATTSAPNVKETPRSFSPQPIVSLSGSLHNRSHNRPLSGTSVGLMIRLICSIDCRSGLKPRNAIHSNYKVITHRGKKRQYYNSQLTSQWPFFWRLLRLIDANHL